MAHTDVAVGIDHTLVCEDPVGGHQIAQDIDEAHQWNVRPESITTVWPVIVSVRHIVTTMSAQSSLSAAFFSSEEDADFSIMSGRRLAVARVPSNRPGATQFTNVSGASATAMQRVRWIRPAFDTA